MRIAAKRDRGHTGRSRGEAICGKTVASCSKVKAEVIPDGSQQSLHTALTKHVDPGSHLFTAAWQGFRGLAAEYRHQVVDHALEYVKGNVHTNGCENFFSLLKRTVKGTCVSVEPFDLGAYLDEQAFRFNERDQNDGRGRFSTLPLAVFSLRLTYEELIGHGAQPA